MGGLGIFASLAILFTWTLAQNIDPIVIKGSKFFYQTNGTQFYMRGIAYQQDVSTNSSASTSQRYTDPLADPAGCRRDLPSLIELRTNLLRVYAIDPTLNHDECMTAFANAGIYVLLDLGQPGTSINRDDPAWNDDLYRRYVSVVDTMIKYNNTFGFLAGNEVSNAPNNTFASAFVKASVRDTKAYIRQRGYRSIGVGYATNDDAGIRENLARYFNCGQDQSAAIDFWGYNIYSWCGDSSFRESGYDVRTRDFANYSVPVFFAEYGCNTIQPRRFTDVRSLYGSDMNDVWSGGIVYMYFQEANDYGLVSVRGNDVERLDDFRYLSSQIASASPTGVNMNQYNPTNTVPAECPAVAETWGAVASPLPPSANPELCGCMMQSLSCVVRQSVRADDYGRLFGLVCGLSRDACRGIAKNATTGNYGAYSMCNATEQLSFAFSQYASSQSNNAQACDFGGSAVRQSSASAAGNCQALLNQAGTNGVGTVTSVPTGTSAPSSTRSPGAAAGGFVTPKFDFGIMQLGVYVLGTLLTGAAMVLL